MGEGNTEGKKKKEIIESNFTPLEAEDMKSKQQGVKNMELIVIETDY